MKDNVNHLNDESLQILVLGDEQSDKFRRTARHVETCSECQQRLHELAAPGEFESGVRSMLSKSSSDSLSGLARAAGSNTEPTKLDFLSPPSHPEMLGRLGRYEIERVIGSGGMGIVLKAYDTELNRPVAVKVLARHLAHSGAAKARFAREAKAAAAVVHEHVVAIHNVEADRDQPFLVMQFVSGESLQARVDRQGPLEFKEILRIGIQIASGLAAAHEQGVVHRDIKPANILLEDRVERALITDFGLARTVDDASLTHTGVVAGTPHYMSPQQANGDSTDHRTDLFSLGSVLYFMAVGHPPFRAERAMGVLHRICQDRQRPLWQANLDIADELSVLIDRLLEKQPARRFASAEAVRVALVDQLAQAQQPNNGLLRRVRRFAIRHPKVIIAAGVATLSVVICGVGSLIWIQKTPHEKVVETPSHQSALTSDMSSGVQPALDPKESTEFAASMSVLRQRISSLNAPGFFAMPENSNDNETQSLQSLHQRLERLQGTSESESLFSQPGDLK
jgi:serine/threonine protein kinase